MKQILLVGEDKLCLALGQCMVEAVLPRWTISGEIDKRGITNLVPRLRDYAQQAKHVQPVLCVADTDGACAVKLIRRWLPKPVDDRFLLRLAVREAESWALADGDAFADALALPRGIVPRDPESLMDVKGTVLRLARRSRNRRVREEVVSSSDPTKPGNGYNVHSCGFVKTHWRARVASQGARSLLRTMDRLRALAAQG